MIPKQWPRWIAASIFKHFEARKETLEMFIEGQSRPSTLQDFFELKVEGPYIKQIDKRNYYVYVLINALIQSKMSETEHYKIYDDVGIVLQGFTPTIEVLKYGSDESLLECLVQIDDNIEVSPLGKVEDSVWIVQADIEAAYEMHLTVE